MPSGALRKDIPQGRVNQVELLDAFPFEDRVALMEVSGELLWAILEQGLSLERGILQVSGLQVVYNPGEPSGQRIRSVKVGDQPLDLSASYRVGTVEILARGGDAYVMARSARSTKLLERQFSEALQATFSARQQIDLPRRGRLLPTHR
jgi:2',3'-cyclic-nucleotide 2'-phosphodiesterase (5'-nucleotidase family)